MEYTNSKMIGSDKGTRLGLSGGRVLVTILEDVHVITLGIDVVKQPGYLDESFDESSHGNLEGLLIGDFMGSTDGKGLGSDEGIKL